MATFKVYYQSEVATEIEDEIIRTIRLPEDTQAKDDLCAPFEVRILQSGRALACDPHHGDELYDSLKDLEDVYGINLSQ